MPANERRPPADPQARRLARYEQLHELGVALAAASTREDVAAIALQRALALVGARAVSLFLESGPGELELVRAVGLSEAFQQRYRRLGPGSQVPQADAFRTGEPVWLRDPKEIAARYPGAAPLAAAEGDLAWAAVPLVLDRRRGAIGIRFSEPRAFDEEERSVIEAVTHECALALDRARLHDAHRRHAERLARVQSTSAALSGAATPPDVAAVAAAAFAILGASGAELHALDRADRVTRVPRAGEPSPSPRSIDAPTIACEVVRTGRAVWISSRAELAERFPREAADPARGGEGAWAAVPLLGSGETLGALTVAFLDERTLEEDDRAFVRLVAGPCAEALARARLYEAMARNRFDAEWSAGVLDALFDAAPVALALFDREMRFTRVNARLAAMNGIPAASHAGRTPLELLPGLPGEQIAAAFRTVLEGGRAIELPLVGETPAAPGTTRRWQETWFPVRVGGAIVGVGVLVVEEPPPAAG